MNDLFLIQKSRTDEIYESICVGRFEYADQMIQDDLEEPENGSFIIGKRICQRVDLYKAWGRKPEALQLAEEALKTAEGKLREILLVKAIGLKASMNDKYSALDLAVKTHEETLRDKTKEITRKQIGRLAAKLKDDKIEATIGQSDEMFEQLFSEQPASGTDPVLDLFIRYNNGEDIMDEFNALLGEQDKKNPNPDVRLQTLAAYIKSSGGSSIRQEIAIIRGKVPGKVVDDLKRSRGFKNSIKRKETVGDYLGL